MESSEDRSSASGGGGAAVTSSSSLSTTTLKKGPWTSAEDSILVAYVQKHGEGNWNNVQKQSGLFRCGKSCRLRWANHLRPNLKKGAFTPEEERLIIELHAKLGNKWARMATQLPGRTDNEIKNYWNTRIKRRQRAGLPVYPPDIQAAISSSNNNNSLSTSTNTNPTAAGSFYGGFNLLGSKFGSNSEKPTSEFHGFTLQSLQQQGMGTSLALLQASSTGSSSECCAAEETWSASRGFEHHHRQLGLVPHLGTSPLFLQDENELAYEVRPSNTNSFFLTGTPNSTTEIDHHRSVNNNGFFLTATSSSTELENHHVPSNNNGFFITGTISNNDGGDGNGSFVNTSSGTRSLVIAEHHQDLKLELPSSQLSTESSDSAITTPGSVINSPNRFKENAITSGKNHRSNGLTLLEAYNKLKADHGSEETFSLQPMHLFNLQQHQLRNTVKHEEAMQQQASHYTNGEVMSALLHGDHHPTAGSNTHNTNPTLQDPEWYPHEPMYIMDYHIAPETGKNNRLHIEHYGEAPVGDSTGIVGIVGGQQTSPVLPGSHTQGNNWELSSCCSWNNMPGACQIGDYNPSLGDCRSINCLPEQIIY